MKNIYNTNDWENYKRQKGIEKELSTPMMYGGKPKQEEVLFDRLGIGMQVALLVGIILTVPLWLPLWIFTELKKGKRK